MTSFYLIAFYLLDWEKKNPLSSVEDMVFSKCC